MKKNILLTLIALMCAMYAQADYYNVNIGDLYYNIYSTDNTATVTYSSSKYSGDIVIPEIVIYRGKTYSVTSIGDNAFYGCTGLTSVTIPNSVTSIGSSAFYGCTGLTSVTISNGVTSIGSYAFSGCDGLTSVTIPNSVTSIGGHAFYGCTGLTSITIPNSVTEIGEDAFSGCSGLTSITIPNSVTSIGSFAFYHCTGLTSVTISNSVTSIGQYAFSGSTGLTSITIPNSVTEIGYHAFSGCTGLTSIVVESGNTKYDSRENCNAIIETATNTLIQGFNTTIIPNSVAGIEEYAFSGSTGLTSVTIPNSVIWIGKYAFYNTGLTSITIPNSVVSIEEWTFRSCDNLIHITIPNSVMWIGEDAFANCKNLTSISVSAGTPPTIKSSTFDHIPTNVSIYVPCNAMETYQTATYWSNFTNYTERFYPLTVTTQDKTKGSVQIIKEATSCTDNMAIFEATANEHYHFTQWSDGNTDNPRTVSVVGDATYTAEFKPDSYTIIVSAGEHGGANGGGTYDYGTTATLTATADAHYHFTQWSDGNTDNPRTVSVVGDATYTAEFAIDRHSITVIYDTQQGVVTGAGTYDYGTQVTLTAVSNKGYEFAQWSNGVTDNPYLLTATEDLSLEAQFIPATAVDNVSADGTIPQKIIRNGQVYILRNGKTYTTTGVEVK